MLQFILHLVGDYWLQTDWQAIHKKKPGPEGMRACFFHCLTYSLPFLLIGRWWQVLLIFLTHYIIDRTHLVEWMIAVKNGALLTPEDYLDEDHRHPVNFGFRKDRPVVLTLWLYIACDNILHIICNYLILRYL